MSIQIDVKRGGVGRSGAFPIAVFTSFSRPLVVADNLKFFIMVGGGDQDIFIESNAVEPFPIGAEMVFLREDTTQVEFFVLGLAVIRSRNGLRKINAQYAAVTLKKIALDEWRLIGDLA